MIFRPTVPRSHALGDDVQHEDFVWQAGVLVGKKTVVEVTLVRSIICKRMKMYEFIHCMNYLIFAIGLFAKNADFLSYGTRNRDTAHMTTCILNLRKHSIHFWPQIMELFASKY